MAIDMVVLQDIYKDLEQMKKRWCSDTIDDPEDMWQQIPEFLSHASVRMGRALELLPQPVLKIISASYGNKLQTKDVTKLLYQYMNDDSSKLEVFVCNNDMNGDPCPGLKKTLKVVYALHNIENTIEIEEGKKMFLEDIFTTN